MHLKSREPAYSNCVGEGARVVGHVLHLQTTATTNLLYKLWELWAPLGQVKVVCGMLQRQLSREASDDNCTRALATGGD